MDDLENRKAFLRYYRTPEETFDKLVQLLAPHLKKNAHMARECVVVKKNLNASHLSIHLKWKNVWLGGNIGCCRDKTSSWYQKCITFVHVIATAVVVPQLLWRCCSALKCGPYLKKNAHAHVARECVVRTIFYVVATAVPQLWSMLSLLWRCCPVLKRGGCVETVCSVLKCIVWGLIYLLLTRRRRTPACLVRLHI